MIRCAVLMALLVLLLGLTRAPRRLSTTRTRAAQMVFEDFGFGSLLATPAPPLVLAAWAEEAGSAAAAAQRAAAGLVVDAGFSCMHAAPVLGGRVLTAGVRRVNLGGKALTNYLKELVSYRCARVPGRLVCAWYWLGARVSCVESVHGIKTGCCIFPSIARVAWCLLLHHVWPARLLLTTTNRAWHWYVLLHTKALISEQSCSACVLEHMTPADL